MQFRAELRKRLRENNIPISALAKKMGLHQSTVRMWHDYASEPKPEMMQKVFKAIDEMRMPSASGVFLTYTRDKQTKDFDKFID